MKKVFLILFILAGFIEFASANHLPGKGDWKIIIREGTFRLYGSDVDSVWSLNSLYAGLGPPNTTRGNLGVWDSLGLYYLTPSRDTSIHDRIVEFGISFQLHPVNKKFNWPEKIYYDGYILIEDHPVDKNSSYETLKSWLPQYEFYHKYENVYRGNFNGMYLIVHYDATETLLVNITIGPIH